MSDSKNYKAVLVFTGFPAYVLDQLLERGLYGKTKGEIIQRLADSQLERLADELDLDIEEAKNLGYIQKEKI